tara:strand:+ start:119 stop:553 length:435 start_codon:yes stop_codon:yes gene_type:complete
MTTENLTEEEQVLELGLKDYTDIVFDPTDPVDYASMMAGPMGKGIVAVGKVRKLLDKLAAIQQKRKKYQSQLQKGKFEYKVGVESNYSPDIKGGEKLINKAQKQLQKLDKEELILKDKLPKGQLPLDLNRGGAVYGNPLMSLKY